MIKQDRILKHQALYETGKWKAVRNINSHCYKSLLLFVQPYAIIKQDSLALRERIKSPFPLQEPELDN